MEPKQKSVRRERTKAGTMKVKRGKGVFDENGKLKIPSQKKSAKEQLEELEKKNPAKTREINKLIKEIENRKTNELEKQKKVEEPQKPLRAVPDEFKSLMQIEYTKVQSVREELIRLCIELIKTPGIKIHDASGETPVTYIQGNIKRRLMTIVPLKNTFSVMLNNGITTRGWTRETVLAKVHELIDALQLPEPSVNA